MATAGSAVNVQINANVTGEESLRDFTARLDDMAHVAGGDLGQALQQASAKLKELGAQDAAVKTFEAVKREATDASAALKRAEGEVANYGRQITAIGAPTAQEAANLQKLQQAADAARLKFQQKNEVLQASKGTLQQYGIAADNTKAAEQRLAAEIDKVKAEVVELAPAMERAGTAGKAGADQVEKSMRGAGDAISSAKNQLLAFAGVATLGNEIKSAAELADQWSNVRSRLQLALGAQTDIAKAMGTTVELAQATYSSFEGTAELYGKIATAGREFGVGQQQALSTTRTINQAIQLSGASADASKAAVNQLLQGLQSGVLRGDEFNSVMEQSPRLARAMADGLGVTIGQLRAMANEGKLTTDTVIRALQNQSSVIEKEFGALPVTIGRALENLKTEWMKFIGTLNDTSGATGLVAAGIDSLAKHLDDIARIATVTGAAMTASFAIQGVQALRRFQVEMAATGGVAALLQTNLDKLSRPVQIAIAVTGFEIGYQIGDMLQSNFEWARKLGVGIVAFFETTISGLRLLKDSAAAVLTDDTISASYDRFAARQRQIADITGEMWDAAKRSPAEVAAATEAATAKAGELGAAANGAGAAAAAAGAAGAAGMGQLSGAAATARDTLTSLAQVLNQKKPTDNGLTEIVRQLTAAHLRGVDLDTLLRARLPEAIDKLSGPELAKFRAEFIRALDEAGIKGTALATGLRLIAEQAATSLGVDVPLAMNRVSESFRQSLDDLSVLVRALPQLKAEGVDTASVVAAALSKMIDSAKSQAEIEAIRGRIEALKKDLSAPLTASLLDQAAEKAVELRNKLDDLKPGINSLDEAMRKLGLSTSTALKQAATDAVEAYDVIKRAGQQEGESYVAWQARKQAAAVEMINRMIAANGGVVDEAIKVRAAIEGVEISAGRASSTLVSGMNAGSQATRTLTGDFRNLTAAVDAYGNSLNRVNQTAGKIDGTGNESFRAGVTQSNAMMAGQGGGAVDNSLPFTLWAKFQAGTLTASDLAGAQAALAAAKSNASISGLGNTSFEGLADDQMWITRLSQIVSAIEAQSSQTSSGTGLFSTRGGSTASSPAPAAAPAPAPSVYTVKVELGSTSTAINVATPADAQRLQQMVQELASAARRVS